MNLKSAKILMKSKRGMIKVWKGQRANISKEINRLSSEIRDIKGAIFRGEINDE